MGNFVYYGIWRLGGIAVPMNPLMQAREVAFYLSNTGAKAFIGSPAFADAATQGAGSADETYGSSTTTRSRD
jgi:long-chain acyl-CoA synthetase